jgi:hypothetical protein
MYPRSIPRRRQAAEFKAKVLAGCNDTDASIKAMALAHGLDILVRK